LSTKNHIMTTFAYSCQELMGDLNKGKIDRVIVTTIDKTNGAIIDMAYKNFRSAATRFVADSEKVGIFSLVDFMHPGCNSLHDIFTKYDGEIYYTNNMKHLKLTREELHITPKLTEDVVVITAYNSGQFN